MPRILRLGVLWQGQYPTNWIQNNALALALHFALPNPRSLLAPNGIGFVCRH